MVFSSAISVNIWKVHEVLSPLSSSSWGGGAIEHNGTPKTFTQLALSKDLSIVLDWSSAMQMHSFFLMCSIALFLSSATHTSKSKKVCGETWQQYDNIQRAIWSTSDVKGKQRLTGKKKIDYIFFVEFLSQLRIEQQSHWQHDLHGKMPLCEISLD